MQSNIKITTHKTNKRFIIWLNTSRHIECTIVRGLHRHSLKYAFPSEEIYTTGKWFMYGLVFFLL